MLAILQAWNQRVRRCERCPYLDPAWSDGITTNRTRWLPRCSLRNGSGVSVLTWQLWVRKVWVQILTPSATACGNSTDHFCKLRLKHPLQRELCLAQHEVYYFSVNYYYFWVHWPHLRSMCFPLHIMKRRTVRKSGEEGRLGGPVS